ncbi:MAG TPA: hypothetical protein VFB99_14120 [Vicinamibacterales bacterium]|jgi:hypothetical protein|nr:hypothetical protein [Vicinamibacterales bacterium]
MNGELVGVPRTTSDAVAPGAAAIDRGYERARLDRNQNRSGSSGWLAIQRT